jgi:hypothetical protein
LGHDIVGGPVDIGASARARVAEPADRHEDEPRVALGQHLVTETQTIHHPGPAVLDERVRGVGQLEEHVSVRSKPG